MAFALIVIGVILLLVGALAPTPYPWGRVLLITGGICLVVGLILFVVAYMGVGIAVERPPAALLGAYYGSI